MILIPYSHLVHPDKWAIYKFNYFEGGKEHEFWRLNQLIFADYPQIWSIFDVSSEFFLIFVH